MGHAAIALSSLLAWFVPPVPPPSASAAPCPVRASAITAGSSHACALLTDGSVRCWGGNYVGQLGDGTTTSRSAPVAVKGIDDAIALAAGERHTCALRRAGTVACWGANESGQAGKRLGLLASMAGPGEPALRPITVAGLTGVRSIAAGEAHAMALTNGGQVYFWGDLPDHPMRMATTGALVKLAFAGARHIAAGAKLGCAWTRDGARCFGPDLHWLGETSKSPFADVKLDGAELLDPFAVGHGHVCGVDGGGTIHCWGEADSLGGNARSSSAQRFGRDVTVSGLPRVVRIASGWRTCAVVADGRVACWGRNPYGALGDGTETRRLIPVWVAGLNDAADVAVGETSTCARTRDGRVLCWGENGYGQLGDGTTEARKHPSETQFCARAPESIFAEQPPRQPLVAALQRSSCYGECPVYSVRVYGDGSLIYRGEHYVRVRGGRTGRLDHAQMQTLRAAFRDANFLEAPYQCGATATDNSTARLYFTDGHKARLISHYHGCQDAPRALTQLEDEIDRILGTEHWVGKGRQRGDALAVEAMEPPLSVPGVTEEH